MAMLDDSAVMMDAANPTLKAVVGDDEEKCDTCKLIVTQVATMLRNPVSPLRATLQNVECRHSAYLIKCQLSTL